MQQRSFARRVPDKLLNTIKGLFSIDFGINEVIRVIKEELRSLFNKSNQRVGYIYEKDI